MYFIFCEASSFVSAPTVGSTVFFLLMPHDSSSVLTPSTDPAMDLQFPLLNTMTKTQLHVFAEQKTSAQCKLITYV